MTVTESTKLGYVFERLLLRDVYTSQLVQPVVQAVGRPVVQPVASCMYALLESMRAQSTGRTAEQRVLPRLPMTASYLRPRLNLPATELTPSIVEETEPTGSYNQIQVHHVQMFIDV